MAHKQPPTTTYLPPSATACRRMRRVSSKSSIMTVSGKGPTCRYRFRVMNMAWQRDGMPCVRVRWDSCACMCSVVCCTRAYGEEARDVVTWSPYGSKKCFARKLANISMVPTPTGHRRLKLLRFTPNVNAPATLAGSATQARMWLSKLATVVGGRQ